MKRKAVTLNAIFTLLKMAFSKKRSLIWAFTLMLLVSLSTVFSLATAQNRPATDVTNSSNPDRLKIRAEVVNSMTSLLGFDTSKYNVKLAKDILVSPTTFPQYEGLTPENIVYNLTSKDGRTVQLMEYFIGDSIRCQIDYLGGATPYYVQPLPTSLSEKTALVLNRYINFRNANNLPSSTLQPILQTLGSISLDGMLNTINSNPNGNHSTYAIRNNLKVEIEVSGPNTEVSLIPIYGGVDYPGVIGIGFLNNGGYLSVFSDSSNLFKTGDTSINVSRDEAINMAWNIATNITSVPIVGVGNVTIQFVKVPLVELVASVRANMTAYPLYLIRIPTDKTYYTVEGMEVAIWADTGQVAYSGFTGSHDVVPNGQVLPSSTPGPTSSASTKAPQTNSGTSNTTLVLVIVGVAVAASITVAGVYIRHRRIIKQQTSLT